MMEQWENSIRKKLEGHESILPEGGLAEFRAALSASHSPRGKSSLAPWLFGLAVAACVALFMVLRLDFRAQKEIQVIEHRPIAVNDNAPVCMDSPGMKEDNLIAEAGGNSTLSSSSHPAHLFETQRADGENIEAVDNEDVVTSDEGAIRGESAPQNEEWTTSPIFADNQPLRKVDMSVGAAAGGVLGLGAIGGVIALLPGMNAPEDMAPVQGDPGGVMIDPVSPENKWTGECDHQLPLRFGLSCRMPLSDRLSLTTGLDYSLYSSTLSYTLSGDKVQRAHYLGIPLRLDWTIASGKRLDVYLGGGFEGDVCVAATLDGTAIRRDGFNLSVIGASGVQYNMTKRFGVYVEPALSYTLPWGRQVLATYRADHPFMFSVASGIRISFGK